ncbi:glycoside hydrolase [Lojkania enalia]|uniref:beta-glucosidase n=1 Tax=Lojkania enalia TaxID=147567 RepID=A0A9P4KEH0_9PLEO|nr:glycoside hydrolase [Didymosphaeria enalia]
MTTKIETILQSLTIEEKVSLLAGRDFWETVPIPSKGVPAIKTSDGPNGARGAIFNGGTRAACFPAAICSAATWNPDLSRRIGNALAEETLTKGARVLLGPTMCNHRHPLGGRNFESFSEDPLLAGKLSAQVVNGLQEKGVAATIKHFAANEQETKRLSVDEIISERALREIYMKPFEISIKEANPWAVMTAYNKINGIHCDSHPLLLQKILRGEWGWNGLVMSDWGGTNSTAGALNAGLDLEMPGPTRHRVTEAVTKAIKDGLLSEATIDERVRNILDLITKVGGFDNPEIPPERSVDNPAHRQLIREAAGQGIVLLKNDNGILPLSKDQVKGKKIALLGLAKEALIHGGGSASLHAHYRISPWDGLHSAYGDSVQFVFAKGAHTYRLLPPLASHCTGLDGNSGWTVELLKHGKTEEPIQVAHGHKEASFNPLTEKFTKLKDVHLSSTFIPDETGSHYLSCSGIGPTKVFINGKLVFEQKGNSEDGMAFLLGGNPEKEFTFPFNKDESYKIRIESSPPTDENDDTGILEGLPGFRMGFMKATEHDEDLLSKAVDIARDCDYAIVFTGHTPVWETEGQDQISFNLPKDGSQDKLVDAVASANPNIIVVNSTGVAIAMPWLSKVPSVVQAWFPGQEAGNAIADVISGTTNPSGRLPISWPKRIEYSPAYSNFPGQMKDGQLTVRYDEGVFVGYRHYDRISAHAVQFPFGFGLSYTSLSLKDGLVTQDSNDKFKATITAVNTSRLQGATVVQLYVGRKQRSQEHPVKTLVAFHKVFLEPGKEQTVELLVSIDDFAYFDEGSGSWKVDGGQYVFSFGQSSVHIESSVTVSIGGDRQLKC